MSTTIDASRTEGRPKTGVRGWAVLALLFTFYVINFADKSVLGLAAEPIMAELEITPTQYGLVSSAFFLVFSLSALAVGFIVDSFRTKPVLTIMALVWTVAQALILAPIGGLLALVLSRTLLGLGEGPAFGVTNHAALKWFPAERRSLAVTGVALGVPIGTMVAIPVLSWMINGFSWQITFASLAFVSLVWAIVWSIVGREGPFVEKAAEPGSAARPTRTIRDYLRVLVTPSFIGVLVAGIASYWSVTLLLTWVPAYLSATAGYNQAETAGFTMGAWLVQAISILVVVGLVSTLMTKRGIPSRWSRGALGGSMVLLSGLAMLGFFLAPRGALSIVFMVLAFGLSACIIPMSQAVISEITPPGTRGGVLGAYTAIYSLTGVVAPALTGFLVDVSPTPQAGFGTVFMVSAVLLITAGIMCMTMTNPQRDAARAGVLPNSTAS